MPWQKILKEDVKEEVDQTTEEVVEESNQPSELEEAQARAEEFENKYLRAHAEMQNIQRRANEERQQLQSTPAGLASDLTITWPNLERALAVEGLTDDVKKGLKWSKSLVSLKEEGVEEIPADRPLTITTTWLSNLTCRWRSIQALSRTSLQKATNSMTASYAAMVVVL